MRRSVKPTTRVTTSQSELPFGRARLGSRGSESGATGSDTYDDEALAVSIIPPRGDAPIEGCSAKSKEQSLSQVRSRVELEDLSVAKESKVSNF